MLKLFFGIIFFYFCLSNSTIEQNKNDLITYQNLNNNIQFGVNPIIDGIANKTRNIDKSL